ncbi:uncharacterized protein CDAR_48031 [Caerostris darwini]|uniref:Uncharacterized protein n=1 Tax=Caerostris darwini TaxID=1538125 RepID=A0AAV4W3N0_9ARAC|nr:uncharacterized protein CDAR_48031 [Caerostris darwini]
MIKELLCLLVICIAVSEAVRCRKTTCLTFQCGATTCPPGYRVKVGGGFCGCCNNCVKTLHEGETCNPIIKFGGDLKHKGVTNSDPMCDYGLICDTDSEKCIKLADEY